MAAQLEMNKILWASYHSVLDVKIRVPKHNFKEWKLNMKNEKIKVN